MDMKIVNKYYSVYFTEEPDKYMKENNLQAYCDYDKLEIIISKKFLDGSNKSMSTIENDLLHESIHAYFNEIGLEEINNEFNVNIITALISNNSIYRDVCSLVEKSFVKPIMYGE